MLDLIRGAARALAEWRRREMARAELEALDDRTLADIGLRRSDIPYVLAGGYVPYRGQRSGIETPAVAANRNTRDRAAA